ncbi:RNA polymerase II transcription elongation factor [Artemisia annua]|uniref:RNA polymerase II transcription elongation factor n=1 Tax=Artemisia annua TaxID=35608 RepID=A0A2U1MUY8_ARTAN|nr:RNA polymerase II transcription elongation factor [Artemisia annua]
MANNNNNKKDEPPVDRWFDLTLGSSFQDNPSSKFCTLRYEFKPASIDKNQPGKLHKTSDNKVAVEFQNNQPGKPKVSFEGSSEDYKDNDAVLFFDGESFRLERLHRSVKRLRHVRQPGESAGVAAAVGVSGLQPEASSPPLGKGSKVQSSNKNFVPATVEVERIEIGNIKSFDGKSREEKVVDNPSVPLDPFYTSPEQKIDDDLEEHLNTINDDDEEIDIGGNDNFETAPERQPFTGIDINIPHQQESDDEINLSDDDGDNGPSAAEALREALREQVNAEESKQRSSSSSGSGSSSSSSSSSDSDSSGDSVTSV